MGTHLKVLRESYLMNTKHDRVQMVFKNLFILIPWMKASALEGLKQLGKSDVMFLVLRICTEG